MRLRARRPAPLSGTRSSTASSSSSSSASSSSSFSPSDVNIRDTADQAKSSSRPRGARRQEPDVPKIAPKAISPNASDILSEATLRSLGYIVDEALFGDLPIAYHPKFQFYWCNLCEVGVPNVYSHFLPNSGPHAGTSYTACKTDILQKYPQSDPHDRLPSSLSAANPYPTHIPGILFAAEGYLCLTCGYLTETEDRVMDHFRNTHGSGREVRLEQVFNLQRFFSVKATSYPWFFSSAPIGAAGSSSAPTIRCGSGHVATVTALSVSSSSDERDSAEQARPTRRSGPVGGRDVPDLPTASISHTPASPASRQRQRPTVDETAADPTMQKRPRLMLSPLSRDSMVDDTSRRSRIPNSSSMGSLSIPRNPSPTRSNRTQLSSHPAILPEVRTSYPMRLDQQRESSKEAPRRRSPVGSAIQPIARPSAARPLPIGYIVDEALFGDLPIAYHPEFQFFRCNICDIGVPNITSHFLQSTVQRRIHRGARFTADVNEILQHHPQSDPHERLPSSLSASNPYPTHIPGIVFAPEGYRCLTCGYLTDKQITFRTHSSEKHGSAQNAKHEQVFNLQRFFAIKVMGGRWFFSSAPIGAAPSRFITSIPVRTGRTDALGTFPVSSLSGDRDSSEQAGPSKRPLGAAGSQMPREVPSGLADSFVTDSVQARPRRRVISDEAAADSRGGKRRRRSSSTPPPPQGPISHAASQKTPIPTPSSTATSSDHRHPSPPSSDLTRLSSSSIAPTTPRVRVTAQETSLPIHIQQALQSIDQLKSSVETLQNKQAETEGKHKEAEDALRAALERVTELEDLVEVEREGRVAQQQKRAAKAKAAKEAKEKADQAKAEWERAQAEAAKALAEAEDEEEEEEEELEELEAQESGQSKEHGRTAEEYESEVEEEVEVLEEDYIPMAELDVDAVMESSIRGGASTGGSRER